MRKNITDNIEKQRRKLIIFFIVSFILVGTIVFYIFKPLLDAILLGIVFGFVFYPIYNYINNKINQKRVSAMIVCIIAILVFTIPILLAINQLSYELISISRFFSQELTPSKLNEFKCHSETCVEIISAIKDNEMIWNIYHSFRVEFSSKLKESLSKIIVGIPSYILSIFIIIFVMYYFFIDGKFFLERVKEINIIPKKHMEQLIAKINEVFQGILFGNIAVGFLQGALTTLGFYIFGLNSPILWGFLAFLFSFIPVLGTAIAWIPASALLFVTSYLNEDQSGILRAVGVFLYCMIIVSNIDNFLKPKLISNKTNIHPVWVFIGIIGGIKIFKAAGIFVGPLLIGIFITLINMFNSESELLFGNENEIVRKKLKKSSNN